MFGPGEEKALGVVSYQASLMQVRWCSMKGPGYAKATVVSRDACRFEVLVLVLVSALACSFGFQSGSVLADSPLMTSGLRHRAAPLQRPSQSHSAKTCLTQ